VTPEALHHALANQEDNFVERKPAGVNRAEIRKTLVAFANSVPEGRTAILFVGVRDGGAIDPLPAPDSLQKTVNDICSRDCYPPVAFRSTVLTENGGSVLAIEIESSRARPHFSGPAYVRKGSQSDVASEQMFREMVESINGKVAELHRLKNQMISIVAIRRRLGDDRPVVGADYRESAEGRIISVDAHRVRFELTSGLRVTEAIDRIEPSYDENHHRPKVVVRGY
jgi:predicted HTH transcriptional regulator